MWKFESASRSCSLFRTAEDCSDFAKGALYGPGRPVLLREVKEGER